LKKIRKTSKKQITKICDDFLSNLEFFKDEIKPAGQIPAVKLYWNWSLSVAHLRGSLLATPLPYLHTPTTAFVFPLLLSQTGKEYGLSVVLLQNLLDSISLSLLSTAFTQLVSV
jgi:hypothetical protein